MNHTTQPPAPHRRPSAPARVRAARATAVLLGLAAMAVPALAPGGSASAAMAAAASAPSSDASLVVPSGQTVQVDQTRTLRYLRIEEGGSLVAPDGYSLTLTVNGVETGGVIESTGGEVTVLEPGTYRGSIVLTVTLENLVPWQALTFPFRQALYVDADGVDASRSVPSAIVGGHVDDAGAQGIGVRSTGENFNGVYVTGADYEVDQSTISLHGNGRSDFVGYGAAVTADDASRLVLDGVDIDNQGAVRTGVVADGGSNVIVKNSRIHTENGTLPSDYQSTVDLSYMQQAPWMLGIVGNVRATNLLGTDTKATYLNSDVSSEGWGVLSTDTGQDTRLTSINSRLRTTGGEGYGSYAIGDAVEEFLGTRLDVDTYAAINRGGSIHYGDSTRSAVAALDESLDLGLTRSELRSIPERSTTIDSDRWGVMWHGAGSVSIDGGTQVTTGLATFLDRGQQVDVDVDGSQGARIRSNQGTLFQVMEDDDPGPQMVDGKLVNTGVYTEPSSAPTKVDTFDVTAVHDEDAVGTFSHINLAGDFFNAIRGNNPAGPFGPGIAGKNLVLTFSDSTVSGVISASTSKHKQDTITAEDHRLLGDVSNTVGPVVNNGVIVTLEDGSTWQVAGTSYLSSLTIGSDSQVEAADGGTVTMTVDGVATPVQAGHTYTGDIVLTTS